MDITKIYGELKQLMMSIAKIIINPTFLRDDEFLYVLCELDIDRVSNSLKNEFPLDSVYFGFAFSELVEKNAISPEALQTVKKRCARFLFSLCDQLVKRLHQKL